MTDQPTGSADPVTEADTAADTEVSPHTPRRRQSLLLSVAAVVLTLDIVTKVLAVNLLTPGQPVPIIGDTVTWTLVRNSGAAFSMATGYTWMLTVIASAVVVRHRLDGPPAGVDVVGDRPGNDPGRRDGKPGRSVFPRAGTAARPCRGLLVDRLVAGVQRRRSLGGRRGHPVGHAVGARVRFRHRRPPARRRR